jgi:hypothetical protein
MEGYSNQSDWTSYITLIDQYFAQVEELRGRITSATGEERTSLITDLIAIFGKIEETVILIFSLFFFLFTLSIFFFPD